MSEFKREHRYWVFKRKYLTQEEDDQLRALGRELEGTPRAMRPCVVVQENWTEYEIVWDLIQQRVEGGAAVEVTDRLLSRLAKKDEEIERLRSELSDCECDFLADLCQRREEELRTALARVEALESQLRQKELVHVGYTNGHQVVYARAESGLFYPDTEHGCEIPLYMLKIHEHRLGVDAALAREGSDSE